MDFSAMCLCGEAFHRRDRSEVCNGAVSPIFHLKVTLLALRKHPGDHYGGSQCQ